MAVSSSSFLYLPDDCLKLIFDVMEKKDLAATSLTCKDFQQLSDDKCRELDLSHRNPPPIPFLRRMLLRFRNLERLHLCYLPTNSLYLISTLRLVARSGLQLEFLSLPARKDYINHNETQALICVSSSLNRLKVLHCGNFVFDDNGIISIAYIFKGIKGLDMSCCGPNVTKDGFDSALRMFRNLERIDISYNMHLSDAWLDSLSIYCPLLEQVICIISNAKSYITISGISKLLGSCSKMRIMVFGEIRFDGCNQHLTRVIVEAQHLTYMEIDQIIWVNMQCGDISCSHFKCERISNKQLKENFIGKW